MIEEENITAKFNEKQEENTTKKPQKSNLTSIN